MSKKQSIGERKDTVTVTLGPKTLEALAAFEQHYADAFVSNWMTRTGLVGGLFFRGLVLEGARLNLKLPEDWKSCLD